uniref:Lymphocyte-specific protein 1 n=1 Tax=Callorhinchus milii TaxID=7868 RepID=A0A4W3IF61_CALMI
MDDLERRRELRKQKREELWRQAERLTAQRSMEDEEEIARERRRRARERRYDQEDDASYTSSTLSTPVSESLGPVENSQFDFGSKTGNSTLDEDEGFSDWTQRREERRQKRMEELGHVEEDRAEEMRPGPPYVLSDGNEREDPEEARGGKRKTWRAEEERRDLERKRREQEEQEEEECRRRERERKKKEEMERMQKEQEERERLQEKQQLDEEKEEREWRKMEGGKGPKGSEVKVSYTSRTWGDRRSYENNGDIAREKTTSQHGYGIHKMTLSDSPEPEDDGELTHLEAEQKLEQIRRSHEEKENEEYERLRRRQSESEQELEELKKKQEERRKHREEEELCRQQQEEEQHARDEEEKRRVKEDIEIRRMEAAERRQKVLSISASSTEEVFVPLSLRSPTLKVRLPHGCPSVTTILERTESLNRSLKKSNSLKKSQPIASVHKIGDRLEQYNTAVESTTKSLRHTSLDMPNPLEDVATKKSMWETGDACNHSSSKGALSKETDGLKVGVSNLINQWISKPSEPGTKASPSKPGQEIKPGEVLSKKSIWENKADFQTSSSSPGGGNNQPAGVRYKFVVTGHGKYEKVLIGDEEQ